MRTRREEDEKRGKRRKRQEGRVCKASCPLAHCEARRCFVSASLVLLASGSVRWLFARRTPTGQELEELKRCGSYSEERERPRKE